MTRVICPLVKKGRCSKVGDCPHKEPHAKMRWCCAEGRCPHVLGGHSDEVGPCVVLTEEEVIAYSL